MQLNHTQQRQLQEICRHIQAKDWSAVKHGISLLQRCNDQQLWHFFGKDLQKFTQRPIVEGKIASLVDPIHQQNVAFYVAAYCGFFDNTPEVYLEDYHYVTDLGWVQRLNETHSLTLVTFSALVHPVGLINVPKLKKI